MESINWRKETLDRIIRIRSQRGPEIGWAMIIRTEVMKSLEEDFGSRIHEDDAEKEIKKTFIDEGLYP